MDAATQDIVVLAEKSALSEARDVFSQLGAPVQAMPLESPSKIPQSRIFIVYFHPGEPESQLHSALEVLKSRRNLDWLLFYTPHHAANSAFHLGMLLGRQTGRSADWACDPRSLKQLLRARNLLAHRDSTDAYSADFDVAATRKRLGLTQEQMAQALNITTRTLQNWEKNLGTSQLLRKTRDLREVLELMDDYVVSSKEEEWLNSPLPALRGRRPIELIAEGKLRDLIVEFQRMREGQPV